MVLDSKSDLINILQKPVISKLDSCVRIGLRLGLVDQGFDVLELVNDLHQHRTFAIRIGDSELDRQYRPKQSMGQQVDVGVFGTWWDWRNELAILGS
jgi:hypothetical protein